jgi:hypothetical protein
MRNPTGNVYAPTEALSSAINRLNDIAELLSDEGRDAEALSLATTAADLEWQLEELGRYDVVDRYSLAI